MMSVLAPAVQSNKGYLTRLLDSSNQCTCPGVNHAGPHGYRSQTPWAQHDTATTLCVSYVADQRTSQLCILYSCSTRCINLSSIFVSCSVLLMDTPPVFFFLK